MTIAYADGSTVDALLLSSQGNVVRAAIPEHDDVHIFKQVDGVWRAENGQAVQIIDGWQKDSRGKVPEERHFICSKELGRQLISSVMNGAEIDAGAAPFYVFSREKRQLHVTVLRGR